MNYLYQLLLFEIVKKLAYCHFFQILLYQKKSSIWSSINENEEGLDLSHFPSTTAELASEKGTSSAKTIKKCHDKLNYLI